MNIDNLFEIYNKITLEMIEKINKDEDISFLIENRQKVLNEITILDADKYDIKKDLESLKIKEADEELQKIIKNKMLNTKQDIKKLKQSQVAYSKYANFNGNAMIFSTKI